MKRFLRVLGIIFLGIIIIFGLIGGWTYWKSTKYEETAVPYIKENIPKLSSWNLKITKSLLAPSILEMTTDDDLEKLMKWFSKLGSLKSIEEPQFININTTVTAEHGKQVIVLYNILAHYQNGDATITMRLLETEKGFEVYQFYLNSKALIN